MARVTAKGLVTSRRGQGLEGLDFARGGLGGAGGQDQQRGEDSVGADEDPPAGYTPWLRASAPKPSRTAGRAKISSSFLYNATRGMYEKAGFVYERPKGKKHCVMRKTVPAA